MRVSISPSTRKGAVDASSTSFTTTPSIAGHLGRDTYSVHHAHPSQMGRAHWLGGGWWPMQQHGSSCSSYALEPGPHLARSITSALSMAPSSSIQNGEAMVPVPVRDPPRQDGQEHSAVAALFRHGSTSLMSAVVVEDGGRRPCGIARGRWVETTNTPRGS